MAICPNCGANIPDGIQFCSECGAPLPQAPVQQARPAYGYRQAAQQAQQAPQGYEPQPGYGAPQGYDPQQGYGAPQGYGVPMQPRVSFTQKVKGFFASLKAAPVKPVNRLLLRILSIVFAVGLLLLAIGIPTGIYLNRCFDESDLASVSGSSKSVAMQYLGAGTNANALRNAIKNSERLSSRKNYEKFVWNNTANTENDKDVKAEVEKVEEKARDSYGGFNWFLMKVGLHNALFIWLGIGLCVLSGCAWWILGGRTATLSQNAIMPAVYGVLAFFVILLFLCLVLGPVSFSTYLSNVRQLSYLLFK